MSLPNPRLSRRALIQAASLAPVVLVLREAWAHPTDANMAAVAAATAHVPKEQLEKVLGKVVTDHGVDRNRYELVARALWTHFVFGAGCVPVPDDKKILEYGYEYKSGGILAENVKRDYFDPLGNDYMTNICAYICGHRAATIAIANAGPGGAAAIDQGVYKLAWDQTEAEMKQKLRCARALGQAQGTAQSMGLGGGC